MKPLVIIIVLSATLAGVAANAAHAPGGAVAAAQESLLVADTHVTYDVRLDTGPARVAWQVTLTDSDPQTAYSDFGYVYYYVSYAVPVLRGASAVSASGPGGSSLPVAVQRLDEGPLDIAQVHFDRNLYYGQQYSFTLTYQLPSARSPNVLALPAYVFLPAIAVGDSSTVTVLTPDDSSYRSSVEDLDCGARARSEYHCAAATDVKVAALVEVMRLGATQRVESAAAMRGGRLDFAVEHFTGEEAWAAHTREIVEAGLPLLETLIGAPYPGPETFEVRESGRREVYGYGGVFICRLRSQCHINLSPLAEDSSILHELAHFWSEPYGSPWIGEGLAEFYARRAAEQLTTLVSPPLIEIGLEPADGQLDLWNPASSLINADSDDYRAVAEGYLGSLRFVESLEHTLGSSGLQHVNAAITRERHVDSRRYLDLLEETEGARLDDLFLKHVFPASMAGTLQDRREARDLFAFIDATASEVGLVLPDRVQSAIRGWRFSAALEDLRELQPALVSYAAARKELDGERSSWERFGLAGSDPERFLARAAIAFEEGDHQTAVHDAEYAHRLATTARTAALYKFLVIVGLASAVLSTLGLGLLLGWRRHGPTPAS